VPYLSALEMSDDKPLYKSADSLLYFKPHLRLTFAVLLADIRMMIAEWHRDGLRQCCCTPNACDIA